MMSYTQPLILLFVIIALIGLVRLRYGKRSRMALMGVLGLLLLSLPCVDWVLSRPLEVQYPIQPFPSAPAQAIVVLSASVRAPVYERPYALPDMDTYQRCEFAAWLHGHWKPLPVLACGGSGPVKKETVADTMRQLLLRAGVPEASIWTEERSSSTHENAVFGAEILRKHGISTIALVVDAKAMPRAEACFRKEGIIVIPAPCSFRKFRTPLEEFTPNWKAINRNEDTLHESLGLVWYWIRRWI